MRAASSSERPGSLLLIGASRGIGLAMAAELLARGWRVTGTVRPGGARTLLHDLADHHGDRLSIATLDITEPGQIAQLRQQLSGRRFDILFVNAGTANLRQEDTIAETSDAEFIRVMLTNALAPLRVIEALQDLVPPEGMIGVMSSGQGSLGNNLHGGHEVYRGSKAALNMYMRCYAARHAADRRALVLMAPGWIRTALGGPKAPFSLEETVPRMVTTLLAQRGTPGLRYLDREGHTVPW
ncbi:C-factor [mine drainage metagenome]|uniref:C-factor n=1 Tax=mine drainage metagenome TaxID=410659 RepID=A0A1J5T139_9ZZZZ